MKETQEEVKIITPNSERAILSIFLKDNDTIIDVDNKGVKSEHFGIAGNKYIYMATKYLYSKNVKPTPLAIKEVLTDEKAKKAIDELGGLDYLTLLDEADVDVESLQIFCDKLKQTYTRRELVSIAEDTKKLMLSQKSEVLNPHELIKSIEEKLTTLEVNETKNEVYKMGEETDKVLKERESNPEEIPGLEIGWTTFDRYTNGGRGGDLIIICAESKTGKSVALTNWATNLSIIDNQPILYIDTEMSHREQEDRILSRLAQIPHDEVVSGMYLIDTEHGLSKEKIPRIKRAKTLLKSGNYYHIYMPTFDLESVKSLAKRFKLQYNIGALFFDYIKIPSTQNGMSRNVQEYQALGYFTSGLKDIAGMLDIPVFSAVQANRSSIGNEDKDATNIGGSYRILQLATKLMFLTNKSDETIAKYGIVNGNQVLAIKYQRNGMSDCPPINIMFNRPYLTMEEC